jgi:hypothetical protein
VPCQFKPFAIRFRAVRGSILSKRAWADLIGAGCCVSVVPQGEKSEGNPITVLFGITKPVDVPRIGPVRLL